MDIKYFVCVYLLWELFFILPSICLFLSTSENLLKTLPGPIWLVLHQIFSSMSVEHVCMCLFFFCESTCMHTSAHPCGDQGMTCLSFSGIHIVLRDTTHLLWRQDLSLVWNSWITLASCWASGIYFFYLSGAAITTAHHQPSFYIVAGDWTQVFQRASHTLYPLSISLISRYVSAADLVNRFPSLYQTVLC